MASSLNIALSGLTALQRAVATTSNNIVNAGTEGYNRQTVNFASGPPIQSGGFYLGSGVSASVVERSYDQFLVEQVRDFTSSSVKLDTVASLSARLDDVLADTESGLNQNIQSFFGAMQSLSGNPSGAAERQVVIAEANALERQTQYLDSTLDQFANEVNSRLGRIVEEVNVIAANIAQVNGSIAALQGTGGSPNTLLDKRDELVKDLAEKVGVSTIEAGAGEVNVLVGSGQPIVTGINYSSLKVVPNASDSKKLEIAYSNSNGSDVVITRQINGGELEGLLEFRDGILDQTRNEMGLVSVGIADRFNQQHNKGLDLNGQFGLNFFNSPTVEVLGNPANSGAATVNVAILDPSVMQPSDYEASFNGASWEVRQVKDGTITSVAPGSATIDGLDFTFGGAPVSGDRFLIRATHNAAGSMQVLVSDTDQIAAAAALRVDVSTANLGTAALNDLDINDVSALPLATDITLTFNPDALGAGVPGFDVTGMTPAVIAYDPSVESQGKLLTLTGIGSVVVSGTPDAGDELTISNNVGASGDNSNMLALADLQTDKLMANGQSTFQEYYARLVSSVGVKTRQSDVNASTEASLLHQANTARQGVSGVNLDEEAANLLKLQQAYQAAAKIVSVSETLFQTLLVATRS